MNRKVLFITYYWPPAGGSGVQRCLKFTKYLPEFGWEPVVYTVREGEYPVIDESLLKDVRPDLRVVKSDIWEPYRLYKKITGRSGERVGVGFISGSGRLSFKEKASRWIRGNFFIPDARKFWIQPSIKNLLDLLEEEKFDAVISSGPPHSAHLIALGLKKKTGIPWIADFRDPWTSVYYYSSMYLSKWADKKHHKLEKKVLESADQIVVVGRQMKQEFSVLTEKPIHIITNGFDADDYRDDAIRPDKKFVISQIGMFMKSQDPFMLWEALQELKLEDPKFAEDLEIRIIGKADSAILQSIKEAGLDKNLNYIGFVPHNEVAEWQARTQILLLLINRVENAEYLLTGKLFEYLAAKRPVLCIGPPNGDAAQILQETGSGSSVHWDDKQEIRKKIMVYYGLYKKECLTSKNAGINKYSRKELTGNLTLLLNEISK